MKIYTKKEANFIPKLSRSDVYAVELSHDMISAVDDEENFLDVLRYAHIRYTMAEAEEMITEMKKAYPDYAEDPYYHHGPAVYPVHAGKHYCPVVYKPWEGHSNIIFYRYKLAGEYFYGITNKANDEPTRYIEASMDGWEKWLDDRKRILRHAWDAKYNPVIN